MKFKCNIDSFVSFWILSDNIDQTRTSNKMSELYVIGSTSSTEGSKRTRERGAKVHVELGSEFVNHIDRSDVTIVEQARRE